MMYAQRDVVSVEAQYRESFTVTPAVVSGLCRWISRRFKNVREKCPCVQKIKDKTTSELLFWYVGCHRVVAGNGRKPMAQRSGSPEGLKMSQGFHQVIARAKRLNMILKHDHMGLDSESTRLMSTYRGRPYRCHSPRANPHHQMAYDAG